MVMAGTGCENAEKVEQILEQVNGDVDAAIEFLIAEQRTEECSANSDSLPSQANTHSNIPRNKVCPCGSKKKYKACCGSALGKQSAKFVVYVPWTFLLLF
ncbi:hypothetical protein glysoja_045087 [Glycine soja]|uniref:Uncharacterized protein n=1 Tax=Glycine soja TaxID=3848 RepID=A0A0B2PG58_GLYSO|nr:hypothetical protein glysoja_045087 [Glycine soja]